MALKSIYEYRKLHGKCTRCCKLNDNLPKVMCKKCMKGLIDRNTLKYKKRREELLKEGIKIRKYTFTANRKRKYE